MPLRRYADREPQEDLGVISVKRFGTDRAAIAAADTEANSEATLHFSPGTYNVASNLTISSAVQFTQGAKIKPASGVTVTINGPMDAGIYQAFDLSASGTIALGANFRAPAILPQWWGVDGTPAGDAAALNAAADAGRETGIPLRIPFDQYEIGAEVNFHRVSVVGDLGGLASAGGAPFAGSTNTFPPIFRVATSGVARAVKIGPASATVAAGRQEIQNLAVILTSAADVGCVGFGSDFSFSQVRLKNLEVRGNSGAEASKEFKGFAFKMGPTGDVDEAFYYNRIEDITCRNLKVGLEIESDHSSDGMRMSIVDGVDCWDCIQNMTFNKVEGNSFRRLSVNQYLGSADHSGNPPTEWGIWLTGHSNVVENTNSEGAGNDPVPHYFIEEGNALFGFRNYGPGQLQLLRTNGTLRGGADIDSFGFMVGGGDGRATVDLGYGAGGFQAQSPLTVNAHMKHGSGGSNVTAGNTYFDRYTAVKDEGTATLGLIVNTTASNQLTYGQSLDLRVTNGVATNFYGIRQTLTDYYDVATLARLGWVTLAAVVKPTASPDINTFRLKWTDGSGSATKDYAIVSGASDSPIVSNSGWEVLTLHHQPTGATGTVQVDVGIVGEGSGDTKKIFVDSILLFAGRLTDYAVRQYIEHAYAESIHSGRVGTTSHPFKAAYLSDTLKIPVLADSTRGAAGTAGRVIFNTDDGQLNVDDGTNWTLPDGTTT